MEDIKVTIETLPNKRTKEYFKSSFKTMPIHFVKENKENKENKVKELDFISKDDIRKVG